MFRIRFEYLKLQNHCRACLRLTHDTRSCKAEVEKNRNRRDGQGDINRNHEGRKANRGRRDTQIVSDQLARHRQRDAAAAVLEEAVVASPRRKPVNRNLSNEFRESFGEEAVRRGAKEKEKAWARRTLIRDEGRGFPQRTGAPEQRDQSVKNGGSGIHNNTWYRSTVEEAAVAKLIYAQHDAWEKAEGQSRQSEEVEPERGNGTTRKRQ